MITADLSSFLESGVSVLLGTRGGDLFPDCSRAMGARVEPGGKEITVFLPEATCARMLANLRSNRRLAVCFARVDHRSLQLKGEAVEIRPADDEDYARIDRYRSALADSLSVIGVHPRLTLRMAHRPSQAVRIRVGSIYLQTPGPNAGDPFGDSKEPR